MTNFEKVISGLNPNQRQAVDTLEGPVLVVAGAGTGKTQVLASRIGNILQNTDVKPGNILCITFTESAVGAMRSRLKQIIGNSAYYVYLHTFHSFCNEVIQTFPDKFSEFRGNPVQLDDLARIKLIRSLIDDLDPERKLQLRPLHNKYQYLYDIISGIQNLKREGVLPQDFADKVTKYLSELEQNPKLNRKGEETLDHQREVKSLQKNLELAEIYAAYAARLSEANMYDYEDMILFVIRRFEEDEELLAYYQEKFLYILVDEYQDTNGAQNELVKLLGSFDDTPNIFAVGDDDQAIYRFQGANVDNLLFFTKHFSSVEVISLTDNYRSTQAILAAAEDSISRNQNRLTNLLPNLDKHLKSHSKYPELKPEVYEFSTGDKENEFVVKQIKQLMDAGEKLSDIAILYRKHSDAEDIVDALVKEGVPIKLARGSNALLEQPVLQLINLLKVVSYQGADRDRLLSFILFYDFLQKEFGLERLDVFKLIAQVNDRNLYAKSADSQLSLFEKIIDLAKTDKDSAWHKFVQKIADWQSASANMSITEFFSKLMHESGFIKQLLEGDMEVEKLNSVNSFYRFVKNLNSRNYKLTLTELLEDIRLLEENGLSVPEQELDLNEDGVNLLTVHAAKGQEFGFVFLIKAFHGNWGGRRKRDTLKLPLFLFKQPETSEAVEAELDYENEDERRLFYVALTRAKQQIFISVAKAYHDGTNSKDVEPSQFISELDEQLIDRSDTAKLEEVDPNYLINSMSSKPIMDLTKHEQLFLKQLVADFTLSASSLNEYLECPLKFKFNRLLRLPIPPNLNISLGNAVHKSLESFMRMLIQGQKPVLDDLLRTFEYALSFELLGGDSYTQTLAEGRDILSKYYENYKEEFVAPAAVEYNFSKHNSVLELEAQDPVPLSGKIDRIDWVDKSKNLVKIIDYKTSSPKTENDIRGLTKTSDRNIMRQLSFYQLLADLDERFRPVGSTNKYRIDHVEVDFLKSQAGKYRKIAIKIEDEDIHLLKEEITDVVQNIRNLNFYGSEKHPLCGECEYCQLFKKTT